MKKISLRKVLLTLGIAIGALLIVAAGLAGWVLSTQSGARWAIARLGVLMKGSFEVEKVEGPLRGPLTLRGLTYKSTTLNARLDTVRLEWRLSRLLRKQLDITLLTADGVHLRTVSRETKKEREKLPDVHLPVNVILRSAAVRRIDATNADGTNPQRLDSIDLVTSAIGDVVRVDRLAVAAPTFAANASGRLQPQGDYPVDLKLDWWMQPAGSPRYAGRGTFTGTLEKLAVLHDLTSPFPAHVDATLTAPLRDLAFSGKLAFSRLRSQAIKPDAPAAELAGAIEAHGSPERFSARGSLDADVATNQLGRVHADLDLSRTGDAWHLGSLVLHFPGRSSEISARGVVRVVEPAMRLDLSLAWQRISWPLRGKPLTTSPRGQATLSGTLDAYKLALEAEIFGPSLPPGRWRLAGNGSRTAMTLSSFDGALMEGTIAGSGRFAWSPQLSWDMTVKGDGLNPAAIAPQYAGRLAFEARTHGRMTPTGPAGEIAVPTLAGTVRGQPVRASSRVELQGKTIVLRETSLAVATARAQVSGSIGPSWNLQWGLDAPDLRQLLADASGSLRASGSLSGPRAALRVRAIAAGQGLALGPRKIARLTLDADLDLSTSGNMRADLSASGIVAAAGERPIENLAISARGARGSHTIALDARNAEGELALAAAGGLVGQSWRGRLQKLDLQSKQAGRWSLASAAPLAISAAEVSLHDFCWVSGDSRLCVAGGWRKVGTSTVQASIKDLPFSLFSPWLPPQVEIAGGLNGKIAAEARSDGLLLARVDLTAGPGEIRYLSAPGEPVAIAYRETRLRFNADTSGASGTLAATLVDIGQISGNVSLPRYNVRGVPARNQTIEGRLRMELRDIGFVQAFVTTAERIHGSVHADVAFAGTLADPKLKGEMRLAGGQADLPEYGLDLRELTLTARGDGTGPLALDGSVRAAAGGRLTLKGQLPLAPNASAPLRFTVAGAGFQVMNTYERRVTVTPNLQLAYDGKTITVTGDVEVPQGRVEYKQKFATLKTSPDVVFVGREPGPQEGATKVSRAVVARVRLMLGDAFSLKALGFDGRLQGSLLVMERPDSPTAATGQITIVSGTYRAYSQDLTIEHAYIRYAGGTIDNPGVDLKAYRKASDGTVAGIIVKGTARNPQTTIYSEPPMGQSEALAYLILGHPLSQATPQEGNLVANAATSLGIAGGNLLGKKIASRFGLETARIETKGGNLEQASLVVGKYLSPRFYLEYGVGVFNQLSTLRISYILSKKWTVRADTSAEGNSADVLYTIESGPGGSKQAVAAETQRPPGRHE